MIPIKYVLLEGVDLAGKSTLYSNLHKATNFSYNIQDRSALSMLCYAILYGRDQRPYREGLLAELCDGNNFHVVLLPDLDVVLQRLATRGDEFQDGDSLVRLHGIFDSEVRRIETLPNVLVVREPLRPEEMTTRVASEISTYTKQDPSELGSYLYKWSRLSSSDEVQFHASFDVPLTHDDSSIYLDPKEGEYYHSITSAVNRIIDDETAGVNPYGVRQTPESRRFYYSSDTCISSIHFLPRSGHLRVLCTLRSTDSIRNGTLDLRFLTQLAAATARSRSEWKIDRITLDVTFNSLHIRRDV